MFHFGFSYVGFIYLLMLFIPNIIWTKHKPVNYEEYSQKESKLLQIIEKIGEILVCCCVLIFSDFNIKFNSIWCIWLAGSFILIVLYEIYWIRYFRSKKEMSDFYKNICGFRSVGSFLVYIFGNIKWNYNAALSFDYIWCYPWNRTYICHEKNKED